MLVPFHDIFGCFGDIHDINYAYKITDDVTTLSQGGAKQQNEEYVCK